MGATSAAPAPNEASRLLPNRARAETREGECNVAKAPELRKKETLTLDFPPPPDGSARFEKIARGMSSSFSTLGICDQGSCNGVILIKYQYKKAASFHNLWIVQHNKRSETFIIISVRTIT